MRRYSRAYRLYQIAAWHQFIILTAYATYLSLVPQPGGLFESVWDKLLHVICWFALTLSLRVAWPTARFPAWAAVALFLYSLLVETLQHFVPERDFNPYDLVGNGVGVVAGYGLALLVWPLVERYVVGGDGRRETGDERRETRDERRETRDERRETRDERRETADDEKGSP